MTELDEAYWTGRYETQETGWDVGAVTAPLRHYIDQVENKNLKVLIPGAGNAYEAEYLLSSGFTDIHVCDLSPLPLRNLASRTGASPALKLIEKNFFDLEGKYDLILEQTFFCAIHPSQRKKYFEKMVELLAPGGRLVGLLFDDKLNSDRPPFGGSMDEYRRYIPKALQVIHFEKCINSIAPRAGREIFMNLRKTGPAD
jgi:methyl halide transferase